MNRDISNAYGQIADTINNDQVIFNIQPPTAWDKLAASTPSEIHEDLLWLTKKVSIVELQRAFDRKTLDKGISNQIVRINVKSHYSYIALCVFFSAVFVFFGQTMFQATKHWAWLVSMYGLALVPFATALHVCVIPQNIAIRAVRALKERVETQPNKLTPEQQEVLARIRRLPKKAAAGVFGFMEEQFGTRLVYEMKPDQLRRLSGYVDGVYRNRQANQQRRSAT